MVAMPAEKLPESETLLVPVNELSPLIDAFVYYQELAFEYPHTSYYRRMLEEARRNLQEAEKRFAAAF